MMKKTISLAAAGLFAFGLAACDIDKTQEGSVTAPKYEVDKTRQGNVDLPEYDVKTPDVAINKEERRIDVPKIEKQEKTVEVPDVDVKPAKEK